MQLDRTHVVVRLRTLSEIGDLALVMIRRYPSALLIGFLSGALVWGIANALLLSWIPIQEAAYGLDDEEALAEIWRYLIWMLLLITLQAPAAGVLMTLYLGDAVFEKRPTWTSVWERVRQKFWHWFWVLGVIRLPVPAMVLLGFRWGQPVSAFWDLLVPLVLTLLMTVLRSNRPFLPEILLLEQCPLRADSDAVITVARRSKSLHAPMAGELSGRYLGVAAILFGLLLSLLSTLLWVRGIVASQWLFMNLFVLLVIYPLAIWIVAGVSTIVRLLSYLDTRIRLEGWEVELAVRAEAMRQFGQEMESVPPQRVTPGNSPSPIRDGQPDGSVSTAVAGARP